MAKTNTNSDESTGPKVIAEWVGSDTSPRVKTRTARVITVKDAKNVLIMDITRDYRWGHETAYRADVSAEPEPFQNWLREQSEFKVTEE